MRYCVPDPAIFLPSAFAFRTFSGLTAIAVKTTVRTKKIQKHQTRGIFHRNANEAEEAFRAETSTRAPGLRATVSPERERENAVATETPATLTE